MIFRKKKKGNQKNSSTHLEERIIAELIFYDGKEDAEQFLLSNKDRLYKPSHIAHSLYPFLKHHGTGTLVTEDKERVRYVLNHSTKFLPDGSRIPNPFLYGGVKK